MREGVQRSTQRLNGSGKDSLEQTRNRGRSWTPASSDEDGEWEVEHRLDGFDRGCTGSSRNQHRPFWFSELHEGILAEVIRDSPVQTVDGRMEEEPPSWLNSTVLTACAWVDTCHP
jgi:hypothetical protein